MEFWYLTDGSLIHLYTGNQTQVWAYHMDKITKEGSVHLINSFSSSDNAIAYVAAVRHEKLTEAHAEALEMNDERHPRYTSTEYVIEALSEGSVGIFYDYAIFYGNEKNEAFTRLTHLREQGKDVRLVKRVTTSEVIG